MAWLSCLVVVPLLCGSTVSDFCFFRLPAEVGTDVLLSMLFPQGGAVVPRLRKYCPQPMCLRSALATAAAAVVLRLLTVVPRGLAVVPQIWSGSTTGRGLVGG